MLGNALLNIALWIVELILNAIEFASLPTQAGTVFMTALAYIIDGFAILNAYFDLTYIFSLLSFIILWDSVKMMYDIFFWVMRKVPFLNIRK